MKRTLAIFLSDEELLDLRRILIDQDEAGALTFLDRHLKKQVQRALEGG